MLQVISFSECLYDFSKITHNVPTTSMLCTCACVHACGRVCVRVHEGAHWGEFVYLYMDVSGQFFSQFIREEYFRWFIREATSVLQTIVMEHHNQIHTNPLVALYKATTKISIYVLLQSCSVPLCVSVPTFFSETNVGPRPNLAHMYG